MSLKNDVKVKRYVACATMTDATIVTLYGELGQTSMKDQIMVSRCLTTPGGRVIAETNPVVFDTFDNQNGIRKEFYMGYSVCQPEDYSVYDRDLAIRYAKNHFSRPIVTYNFTYLNHDQIEALMLNEVKFVANKKFAHTEIATMSFECLDE